MNVELLRQLGQRLLALDGGQSHLRLESRCVVPTWSSGHCFSCAARILAAFRQKLHLSRCSVFPSHLSASLASQSRTASWVKTKPRIRSISAKSRRLSL